MSETSYDLCIVGGGPAGQAAAEQAVTAGLSVAMIDEQPRMGGQILRQPPTAMSVRNWMRGRAYRDLQALLARVQALDAIDWLGGTSVLGVFPRAEGGFAIAAAGAEGRRTIGATRVLIAAGCYDMPVAFPGWTLPGVMSAGAVQAFVKSQQVVPGDRFVFIGTHPLQLIVADQIVRAGGQVARLCFGQPLGGALARVLRDPWTALRHAGPLVDAAGAYLRLRRAGVPVTFGIGLRAARGEDRVAAVELSDGVVACDVVATCFGFLPQSDLPRQIGCTVARDAQTGGWTTDADAWLRSSVAGVSVAGETTGVAGAEIAMREGRIAGIGIVRDFGRIDTADAERRAAPVRRELDRLRKFARLLADIAAPGDAIAGLADDDTIICRCEDVTRGQIVAALSGAAAPGAASALKLVTRAGMGVCQGRSCEHAVMALVAAETGATTGFTARFPVRPAAIGDLI